MVIVLLMVVTIVAQECKAKPRLVKMEQLTNALLQIQRKHCPVLMQGHPYLNAQVNHSSI